MYRTLYHSSFEVSHFLIENLYGRDHDLHDFHDRDLHVHDPNDYDHVPNVYVLHDYDCVPHDYDYDPFHHDHDHMIICVNFPEEVYQIIIWFIV